MNITRVRATKWREIKKSQIQDALKRKSGKVLDFNINKNSKDKISERKPTSVAIQQEMVMVSLRLDKLKKGYYSKKRKPLAVKQFSNLKMDEESPCKVFVFIGWLRIILACVSS